MENPETAKMAAKSKIKLSATVLGLLALFGLAAEYGRETAPLDEATVVYVRSRAAVPVPAEEVSAPAAVNPAAEQTEQAAGVSVSEFLGYLREVSDKADAVTKPESALEQIILPQPEPMPAVEPVVSEEQVIEITDDNGEVVELVEVKGEPAEPEAVAVVHEPEGANESAPVQAPVSAEVQAPEPAADVEAAIDILPAAAGLIEESAAAEDKSGEVVVNADENMLSDEENGPAVDMMKEIIEREQAAGGEK